METIWCMSSETYFHSSATDSARCLVGWAQNRMQAAGVGPYMFVVLNSVCVGSQNAGLRRGCDRSVGLGMATGGLKDNFLKNENQYWIEKKKKRRRKSLCLLSWVTPVEPENTGSPRCQIPSFPDPIVELHTWCHWILGIPAVAVRVSATLGFGKSGSVEITCTINRFKICTASLVRVSVQETVSIVDGRRTPSISDHMVKNRMDTTLLFTSHKNTLNWKNQGKKTVPDQHDDPKMRGWARQLTAYRVSKFVIGYDKFV